MTSPGTPASPTVVVLDVCTVEACMQATSHESTCDCRCGGAGHGLAWREARQRARATMTRRTGGTGFTAAMLAAIDDDEM